MADHHVLRLPLAHYRSSEAVQTFGTPQDQFRVKRRDRAGGVIHEYRLVA